MDTEFLQNLDRQILLGVFVAFVAVGAGAGAAYYLSSSKKRRGWFYPQIQNLFSFHNAYLTPLKKSMELFFV